MAEGSSRKIAIFDFDGTLVKGDSLWPFLVAVAGWRRAGAAFARALGDAVRPGRKTEDVDRRTLFKRRLLAQILTGRDLASLQPAREAIKAWPRWNEAVVARLRAHKAEGCHILVASGGLDLYLPDLLAGLPVDTLICTQMDVRDGVLTGAMRQGNCVRAEKARRVAAWLTEHGPFEESWGYGNLPHDVPMLELVQRRVII